MGYRELEGLDLRGKVVLMLRYEPQEKDEASPFDGKRPSRWSAVRYKVVQARERGAAADPHRRDLARQPGRIATAAHAAAITALTHEPFDLNIATTLPHRPPDEPPRSRRFAGGCGRPVECSHGP